MTAQPSPPSSSSTLSPCPAAALRSVPPLPLPWLLATVLYSSRNLPTVGASRGGTHTVFVWPWCTVSLQNLASSSLGYTPEVELLHRMGILRLAFGGTAILSPSGDTTWHSYQGCASVPVSPHPRPRPGFICSHFGDSHCFIGEAKASQGGRGNKPTGRGGLGAETELVTCLAEVQACRDKAGNGAGEIDPGEPWTPWEEPGGHSRGDQKLLLGSGQQVMGPQARTRINPWVMGREGGWRGRERLGSQVRDA